MFSLIADGFDHNCEGYNRRDFLSVGTLGFGGLTLSHLLAAEARAANDGSLVNDKAVVVLNLQGGPTHIETFDPKMTAPSEYRAMFGEVKTSLPGVTFGSDFPRLAKLANQMAVVRCYRHGIGSHGTAAKHVMAGGNPTGANMASLYSRIAGTTSPRTGIPSATVIPPPAVGDEYKKLGAQISRITDTGTLSSTFKPFDPSAGGEIVRNMQLRVPKGRLDDRRTLLSNLDSFKRQVDGTNLLSGADQFQQQAFDVILGSISQAFDLSQENPRVLARYDTSKFAIPEWLQKKKSNVPRQSPISLGKQMLMARRLVEADCRFVTVTSAGWDMHGNAFGINDGMPILGPAVDRAASAFIEDLAERGLSDRVLLVITGEFGRTPRINKKAGRDHWGNLCTLAFVGGGLPMGQVIGQSDRIAAVPAGEVISSSNVFATIMHTLLNVGEVRVTGGVPSDIARYLEDATPISQLV